MYTVIYFTMDIRQNYSPYIVVYIVCLYHQLLQVNNKF